MMSAKAWVANWKSLGPELERIAIEEHFASDLGETLLSLNDVSQAALISYPPTAESGVIEMQRFFSKLYK